MQTTMEEVSMHEKQTQQDPDITGLDVLPGVSNYLIGNDPAAWRKHVRRYAKVQYGSAHPGIDLVYYGGQQQLEYDFVVAPGADPRQIRLAFDGDDSGNTATAKVEY
jgi:hypothetical protein